MFLYVAFFALGTYFLFVSIQKAQHVRIPVKWPIRRFYTKIGRRSGMTRTKLELAF